MGRAHQALALGDECVERLVDDLQRDEAAALPRHQPAQQRDVPVGEQRGAAVLRLAQHRVHRLRRRTSAQEPGAMPRARAAGKDMLGIKQGCCHPQHITIRRDAGQRRGHNPP